LRRATDAGTPDSGPCVLGSDLTAPAGFNACKVGATSAGDTMTLLQALELVREYSTEIEIVVETEIVYEYKELECEWTIPPARV